MQDRDEWRRGGWHHEFRDGRDGWWFVVDGIWYFYDAPIYPYPTYIPNVVYIPDMDDYDYYGYGAPPPVEVVAPPAPVAPSANAYYYFCRDSQTYYPYVASCASPWQPVPIAPPQ